MSSDTTPVLIGAGQFTQRNAEPRAALSPLDLMIVCAQRAAEDAGLQAVALGGLDRIAVVGSNSWDGDALPRLLAEALGARPAHSQYTGNGGNHPQALVADAAEAIATGRSRLALIGGAEALNTLAKAARTGQDLSFGYNRHADYGGVTVSEALHGLAAPIVAYPLIESVIAERSGASPDDHRLMLGDLMAPFSRAAAANPYAWFPTARAPAEIAAAGADNRYVGFPYTKYMNAVIQVDQGAAVLMASRGHALALGVPPERMIYLHGAAEANDHWHLSERHDLGRSPAIEAVGREALDMAGLEIGQIELFDLYSCFPAVVQMTRQALGVPEGKALTVTGGLPYHGGPGNNYATHAIAEMAARLRADPQVYGMITANGYYATKHAIGVYSAQPPAKPFQRRASVQARIDALPRRRMTDEPNGRGRIDAFTVMHGRGGEPEQGVVVGRLKDGARFVAHTPKDRALLESLMAGEAVGRPGRAVAGDPVNLFVPD